MGDAIGPIRRDDDRLVQIKIGNSTVSRGGHFVTQAEIQSEIGSHPEIILDKSGQVPITRGIGTLQFVLLEKLRNAQQHVRHTISARLGNKVRRITSIKGIPAPGSGFLEEVALLAPEVNLKFQGMLSMCPAQSVGDLEDVFHGEFGRPEGVAQGAEAGDFYKG